MVSAHFRVRLFLASNYTRFSWPTRCDLKDRLTDQRYDLTGGHSGEVVMRAAAHVQITEFDARRKVGWSA